MMILHGFRTSRTLITILLATFLLGTVLAEDSPKKVTKTEGLNALITKVQAPYPPIARQLKIEGSVELEALVTENGTVEQVSIVSGNPVLTRPASDAIKKWKFTPFTADGKAVKALVPVSMSFKM